jgi:hypothetical protein
MRRCSIFLLIGLVLAETLYGAVNHGGRGLIYVSSAKIIPRGHIEFYTGTRFFGRVAQFGGDSKAYTLWDVQGFASLNFGVNDHLELAISPIVYQDTNKGDKGSGEDINFPDDLFLSAKLGSFGPVESPFSFGGRLYARIPTANIHNITYEPYTAGRLEVGLTGMVSYYSNRIFPEEGWQIHGNLGYLNHNDVGKELTDNPDDPTAQSMSSELLLGVGFLYPFDTFDFSAEFNSRIYLQQPPVTAYSRESVTYLTGGVYYKPYSWITIEMGIDIKLFSGEDQSDYQNTSLPPPPPDFPNYPSWRGVLGVKLAILPTSLYAPSERSKLERRAMERQSSFENLVKEKQDTEEAETELSRIRSRREQLEEELRRLSKLLEEEKKKKKEEEK